MSNITEWEFTAEVMALINQLLQQNPAWPFREARAKDSAKRRDLTLYDRAGKPVLVEHV
jgi:hypothetical protein